ncbi:MAG: hypothetical protein LBB88_06635 [Planctomycetaceae bacterium]|nr:hypothetical protein [Planctomycetaceae bacterium]
MILQLRKRYKNEVSQKKKLYNDILAANKEKKDELIQKGEDPKKKPGTPEITRVPINEPFREKFTGASVQGQIAKWEAEMFTLGRQIIGQIDSKMIAIETLTLEANRTANRLELLIEHFQQIIDKLENNKKNQNNTQNIVTNNLTNNVTKIISTNSTTDSSIPDNENNKPTNFKNYLNELETEINDFKDKVDEFNNAKEVTILKAIPNQEKIQPDKSEKSDKFSPSIYREIISNEIANQKSTTSEIKSNSIKSPVNENPFALSSPRLPASAIDNDVNNIRTNIPVDNRVNNPKSGLSIDSLFNDSSAQNENIPNRKQIEMLANYGYNSKEIAQNLNISIGEVELILSTKK